MAFTSWMQHQTVAKKKVLKVLGKRPKRRSTPLSHEEVRELFHLFQTAPDVLSTSARWQEEKVLTQEDKRILLRAEKAYYKALLLPNEASSLVYRSWAYWVRWVVVGFMGMMTLLCAWNLFRYWNEIHMPWWGVLIIGWIVAGIIGQQVTRVLHARCAPIEEQGYREELAALAQQGWPFAQMIQGQMSQGFQPTRMQWKQIFYWKSSVLDLTRPTT